jgi:hypothetical protein
MAKEVKESKKVKAHVVAIDRGYYKGEIVNPGKKFIYEGNLSKKGRLPLWVEEIKSKKSVEPESSLSSDDLV